MRPGPEIYKHAFTLSRLVLRWGIKLESLVYPFAHSDSKFLFYSLLLIAISCSTFVLFGSSPRFWCCLFPPWHNVLFVFEDWFAFSRKRKKCVIILFALVTTSTSILLLSYDDVMLMISSLPATEAVFILPSRSTYCTFVLLSRIVRQFALMYLSMEKALPRGIRPCLYLGGTHFSCGRVSQQCTVVLMFIHVYNTISE